MKTLTLAPWFALILMCGAALGQGLGLVNLNNNFIPPGGTAKAFILGPDGLPMPKALGSVEILDVTGHVIRSGRLAAAGVFAFGFVEIPGTVPGGDGSLAIRVWDESTGPNDDTATFKLSTVVTLRGLGGDGRPIPTLGQSGNFTGLCLCPQFWDTSSQIYVITPVGDQLRVLASGNNSISWALSRNVSVALGSARASRAADGALAVRIGRVESPPFSEQ